MENKLKCGKWLKPSYCKNEYSGKCIELSCSKCCKNKNCSYHFVHQLMSNIRYTRIPSLKSCVFGIQLKFLEWVLKDIPIKIQNLIFSFLINGSICFVCENKFLYNLSPNKLRNYCEGNNCKKFNCKLHCCFDCYKSTLLTIKF